VLKSISLYKYNIEFENLNQLGELAICFLTIFLIKAPTLFGAPFLDIIKMTMKS